jgi:RHS repeat-associated protein
VTESSLNDYTFDAENRIATAAAETYTYDGDGNRVLKTAGGTTGSTYWYGADGTVVDEQTVQINVNTGYPANQIRNLYFNGKLAYRMGFTESVYPSLLILPDQIGSSRATVGTYGGAGTPDNNHFVAAYYPFGTYITQPATNLEQQFTGKIRDPETGNDYFGARYYSSNTARFMSPDWSANEEPIPYAKMDDPQSLNLYSYVRNSPLTIVDPDGHQQVDVKSKGCQFEHLSDCMALAQAQQQGYQQPDASKPAEVTLTNVTYNETSGMRASPDAKPDDKDGANKLHDARLAVAEIADRILNSNHPEREQVPNDLSTRTVSDLNAGNRDIIAAHNDSLNAARQALNGSNTTRGAMHFRTGTHPLTSLYGNKSTMSFGPFNNAQGGKVYLTVAP